MFFNIGIFNNRLEIYSRPDSMQIADSSQASHSPYLLSTKSILEVPLMLTSRRLYGFSLALALLLSSQANAGRVLEVGTEIVDVIAFGAISDDTLALSAIDGSGLNGDQHSTVENGVSWAAGELQNFSTIQAEAGNPSLTGNNPLNWYAILLDQPREIESIRLWNYNDPNATNIGIQNFQVFTSGDGVNYDLAIADVLPQAPGTDDYTGSEFALGGPSAAVVLIEALDNYGAGVGEATIGAISGFSEIQVVEVPEVDSIALVLIGVGCLAVVKRRR